MITVHDRQINTLIDHVRDYRRGYNAEVYANAACQLADEVERLRQRLQDLLYTDAEREAVTQLIRDVRAPQNFEAPNAPYRPDLLDFAADARRLADLLEMSDAQAADQQAEAPAAQAADPWADDPIARAIATVLDGHAGLPAYVEAAAAITRELQQLRTSTAAEASDANAKQAAREKRCQDSMLEALRSLQAIEVALNRAQEHRLAAADLIFPYSEPPF